MAWMIVTTPKVPRKITDKHLSLTIIPIQDIATALLQLRLKCTISTANMTMLMYNIFTCLGSKLNCWVVTWIQFSYVPHIINSLVTAKEYTLPPVVCSTRTHSRVSRSHSWLQTTLYYYTNTAYSLEYYSLPFQVLKLAKVSSYRSHYIFWDDTAVWYSRLLPKSPVLELHLRTAFSAGNLP